VRLCSSTQSRLYTPRSSMCPLATVSAVLRRVAFVACATPTTTYLIMEIASFDDLLQTAARQSVPQRLLLVFCQAELPEDATPQQRAEFAAGEGGVLVPVASVDKFPEMLGSFERLRTEAERMDLSWDIVFVAAMERGPDTPEQVALVDRTLEALVEAVKASQVQSCVPFDTTGTVVALGV